MRSRQHSFALNDSGAIAILFAFTLTIICVCVGGAVDYARYTSARNQTSAAVDAAVLAGARTLLLGGSSSAAVTTAQEYYAKNVADRFQVTSDTINFSVTGDNSITANGNAQLPTTLLKLAGIQTLPLLNTTGTQFAKAKIVSGGGGNIEVALMLYVTGSMCDDGVGPCTSSTKLDALKEGAKDLVKIVVQSDQSDFKSRVSLVPFSRRIRVAPNGGGSSIMKALTDLDSTWSGWVNNCTGWTFASAGSGSESGDSYTCDGYVLQQVSNWKIRPCVTERYFDSSSSMDTTDDMPGSGAWLNAYDGTRRPISTDSATNTPSSGLGAVSSDPANHSNYSSSGWCGTPEANEVVPLSDDKNMLLNKIDGFQASEQTAGALGTAFTWYTLSPNWNSIWSGEGAAPYSDLTAMQANGKPKLRKVAILMSDGVFNTYRGWSGQDQQKVSDYAKAMCSSMKAQGIEIYAIAYDLDSLPSTERAIAEDTMRSCGSDIEHFYNTLDATQLQSAFRDIAVTLSSISLAQ